MARKSSHDQVIKTTTLLVGGQQLLQRQWTRTGRAGGPRGEGTKRISSVTCNTRTDAHMRTLISAVVHRALTRVDAMCSKLQLLGTNDVPRPQDQATTTLYRDDCLISLFSRRGARIECLTGDFVTT
jgi:hypothetical protein